MLAVYYERFDNTGFLTINSNLTSLHEDDFKSTLKAEYLLMRLH